MSTPILKKNGRTEHATPVNFSDVRGIFYNTPHFTPHFTPNTRPYKTAQEAPQNRPTVARAHKTPCKGLVKSEAVVISSARPVFNVAKYSPKSEIWGT